MSIEFIISTILAIVALALSVFNYIHSRELERENKQSSYFDKKTVILRLLEECMLDPNRYIRKATFTREIQDAKYIVNAYFNDELEELLRNALSEIEDYHGVLRKDVNVNAANLTGSLIDVFRAVVKDLKVVKTKK